MEARCGGSVQVGAASRAESAPTACDCRAGCTETKGLQQGKCFQPPPACRQLCAVQLPWPGCPQQLPAMRCSKLDGRPAAPVTCHWRAT